MLFTHIEDSVSTGLFKPTLGFEFGDVRVKLLETIISVILTGHI